MTRVIINNGKSSASPADELYLLGERNCLTLRWYDIDYKIFHLISENMATIFIFLSIMDKIKTILHSNSRWRYPTIKKFVFCQDLKSRLMELHNKNSVQTRTKLSKIIDPKLVKMFSMYMNFIPVSSTLNRYLIKIIWI